MKRVLRQWLAGLLSVALVFTLLPAAALAEEADGATGQTAVAQVQALIDALPDAEEITAETRADVEAQIDAIDGAMTELSEDEAAALDTARYDAAVAAVLALDAPSALEQVQALIDALLDAEEITSENRADVETQLTAIDEAKQDLTDDELDTLDITRYMAAVEAILALDDMAGADVPKTIANDIKYMDWNSSQKKLEEKTCSSATKVESNMTEWSNGWYVVSGNVTVSGRINIVGTVHLILKDDCTLTASSGIEVKGGSEGDILIIYGQSGQSGKLSATGNFSNAGIGSWYGNNGGTITINGGTVTAIGGSFSAGIGGGREGGAGNITINGGNVTATGGSGAAAISTGSNGTGGTITISGGSVTATSTLSGIGGGYRGGGLKITISGGDVTVSRNLGDDSNYYTEDGSFSTGTNGNAVIHVSSTIRDKSQQDSWSGIIFEESTGTVYEDQTLRPGFALSSGESLTVGSSASLTIPDGITLTVPADVTVTNNGTINVGTRDGMNASLNNEGTITNNNTIDVWGQLTNGESGIQNQGSGKIVYHFKVDVTAPNFTSEQYGYQQPSAQKITIKNTGELSATITQVEIIGSGKDDFILNKGNNTKRVKGILIDSAVKKKKGQKFDVSR